MSALFGDVICRRARTSERDDFYAFLQKLHLFRIKPGKGSLLGMRPIHRKGMTAFVATVEVCKHDVSAHVEFVYDRWVVVSLLIVSQPLDLRNKCKARSIPSSLPGLRGDTLPSPPSSIDHNCVAR
jgi:hypothetical protein